MFDFTKHQQSNPNWSILGIDFGTKKLGIAIISNIARVVLPICTIKTANLSQQCQSIVELLKERAISLIVVGMPIQMDGQYGSQTLVVQKFIDELAAQVVVPIINHDERMSSKLALRMLGERQLKRKDKQHADDELAACLMLESFCKAHGCY